MRLMRSLRLSGAWSASCRLQSCFSGDGPPSIPAPFLPSPSTLFQLQPYGVSSIPSPRYPALLSLSPRPPCVKQFLTGALAVHSSFIPPTRWPPRHPTEPHIRFVPT